MTLKNEVDQTVTVELDSEFNVRDAISLGGWLKQIPSAIPVVLDFRKVRWMSNSAAAALIPALTSLHRRGLWAVGIEGIDELAALRAPAHALPA